MKFFLLIEKVQLVSKTDIRLSNKSRNNKNMGKSGSQMFLYFVLNPNKKISQFRKIFSKNYKIVNPPSLSHKPEKIS
jgi:hypothetical protein